MLVQYFSAISTRPQFLHQPLDNKSSMLKMSENLHLERD